MKKLIITLGLVITHTGFSQNIIENGTNVGIGHANPYTKLHVNGDLGIGLLNGTYIEGFSIDYVDGGSGTTTFKNNRWGGNIYFKRNSSQGERTQFLFGGSGNHYMNIYNDNNQAKVSFSSLGNSYINGGNLGIGTTTPTEKLQIENGVVKVRSNNNSNRFIWSRTDNTMAAGLGGDGARKLFLIADNSTRMTIDGNTSNVGIGTTSPGERLEVNGNITVGNSNTVGSFINIIGAGSHQSFGLQLGHASNPDGKASILSHTTTGNLSFSVQENLAMTVNALGEVGIGTTNTQGFKLGVDGRIAATEVKVATYPNWPDFVFENNYNLPTLKEVEQQIKEKGHLKNIPSAKVVKKDGFFLGEMDSKLLQKIEELMLYTIEQEKSLKIKDLKIKNLEEKIELQESRLKKIETLLASKN